LIGRGQRDEVPVKQGIGDAGLILHARSERYECLAGRPDIDNKVGLEREHCFKICRITAPGDAPDFRPPANVRQHVEALLRMVGSRPAEQQIGRKRIQQDGRWRTGGKYTLDARRHRYGPSGTVHDGCRTRSIRYQQNCCQTPKESASVEPHHLPTITSEALMTAQASSPALRSRSATASLVIEAVMMSPPPISMLTCDVV